MVVGVLIVYPGDCVADWELWLAATAQHHEFGTAYRQSWKRSKFKIQCMVSTECVLLSHHCRVEKSLSLNFKWGPSISNIKIEMIIKKNKIIQLYYSILLIKEWKFTYPCFRRPQMNNPWQMNRPVRSLTETILISDIFYVDFLSLL